MEHRGPVLDRRPDGRDMAGVGPPGLNRVSPVTVSAAEMSEGQRLFDHETFGGNGRTCRTCHSGDDGTIDPAEVAERLSEDPSEPLFRHDGLDDFFSGTSRIAAHATILIERDLPEGVVLVDDPSATSVVLARGVPSTVNTPGLDPALMYDMRDADLQAQASGAITRHAQADHRADDGTTRRHRHLPANRQPLLFEQVVEVVRPGRCQLQNCRRDTRRPRSAGGSSSSMRRGTRRARRGCVPCVTAGRC